MHVERVAVVEGGGDPAGGAVGGALSADQRATGFAANSVRARAVFAEHLPGDFESALSGRLSGQTLGLQFLLSTESCKFNDI